MTFRPSSAAARTSRRTGDIGLFKIVSEGGVAAGVRRIEAVTGQGALDWVAQSDQVLRELAALVKASRDDVEDKVRQLVERSRKLEKEVAGLKSKLASGQGSDSVQRARSMSRASKSSRRASTARTRLRCATPSISSRASCARPRSCWRRCRSPTKSC